jgi:TonB family protein
MPMTAHALLRLFFAVLIFGGLCSPGSAEPTSSPIYDYADVDVKPEPKKRLKMSFPASTRRDGANPSITVRFVVTKTGRVSDVVIVRFSHPELIDIALDLYSKARFSPGTKNGEAVDTRMEMSHVFRPDSPT